MQSFVKSFETYPITVKGEPKLHIYFADLNNWANATSPDWKEAVVTVLYAFYDV